MLMVKGFVFGIRRSGGSDLADSDILAVYMCEDLKICVTFCIT